MPPSIELSSAYASSIGDGTYLLEEADSFGDPRLKAKGNLYIVGEGTASEVTGSIKAIRNQYYGDVSTTNPLDIASSLQQSIEAANGLLLRQNAIGVALVAGVVYENKLVVMHLGDSKAFLYSGTDGAIEPLTSQANAYAALGTQTKLATGFAGRILKDKDIIILCSGSLADALREEEIARIVSAGQGAISPQELANRLLSRSSSPDKASGATVVVVACKGMLNAEPALVDAMQLRAPAHQSEFSNLASRTLENSSGRKESQDPPSTGGRARKYFGIAGVFTIALLAFFLGGRGFNFSSLSLSDLGKNLNSALSSERTSQSASTPGTLGSDTRQDPTAIAGRVVGSFGDVDRAWAQLDTLWRKGEAGNGDAWQDIVALLEQLQIQTPADPKIDEKLTAARINLAYTQKKKEVESYWGNGDVSVGTVSSWSRIVEILESLYRLKLPPDAALYVKDRLYTAHMNYGKALEAGNRSIEAGGQYERARQIYPNRPEAQDALKKLK